MLPEWAITSFTEYVAKGTPVSGFLRAILCNDLMDAFGRADDENCRIMFHYAKYVHNKIPMSCHGSKRIYKLWCESGGLEGQKKAEEEIPPCMKNIRERKSARGGK